MRNLRLKLLVSLMIFAVVLVTVVMWTNRQLLITDIKEQQHNSIELIENHIVNDMKTIDNVHYYFDYILSDELEVELRKMIAYYEQNPDVLSWDLEAMKQQHGMEIFIIDEKNTIIHTTFAPDLGFNLSSGEAFAKVLNERRLSGEYYSDAINTNTSTGELWKYSYLATPDKKYVFELGIKPTDVELFQKFDFLQAAKNLKDKYDDLIEVRILNARGYYLDANGEANYKIEHQSEQFKEAYQKAVDTMTPVQYTEEFENGYIETSRFIPYEAEQIRGTTTKRVIYIEYGNKKELASLERLTQQFWMTLVIAVVTSLILLFTIIRILTKTINLATFDPLTGANNRASYLNEIEQLLQRNKQTGLLLFDLDNFKKVNDSYGHVEGDRILIETVSILKAAAEKENMVVRFGGDEFAIIVNNATFEKMHAIANEVLQAFRLKKNGEDEVWHPLSISVGGALQQEEDETEVTLFMRADQALYQSKNNGKSCYTAINLFDEND